MNALRTVGVKKALLFVWWELYKGFLRIVVAPPVRVWLLRLAGADIGEDTMILNATLVNLHHHGLTKLHIGRSCYIADDVLLDVRGGIIMGDGVTVSNRCAIVTHINVGYPDHPLQKLYPMRESPVTIQKGAYIGTGAIILPGVIVGERSIVGAGAVVTKPIPARTVAVGVPAKVVKRLG
jgi:acetyltransferase-like isoleucine patch superfamily enzyme